MKELRCTLYGYGDDQNPYTETVEFLDDLVLEFITDFTRKAMEIGRSGRVQVKFIYSEKATKLCEISTVDLTGTT